MEQTRGLNGDLADVILEILCSINTKYNIARVCLSDFYCFFEKLAEEFPKIFPKLNSIVTRGSFGDTICYSKILAKSLERSLMIGARISKDLDHIELAAPANEILERLRGRIGNEFVENLKPIGDRLAELLKKRKMI